MKSCLYVELLPSSASVVILISSSGKIIKIIINNKKTKKGPYGELESFPGNHS
jgi:hypothetical protein